MILCVDRGRLVMEKTEQYCKQQSLRYLSVCAPCGLAEALVARARATLLEVEIQGLGIKT